MYRGEKFTFSVLANILRTYIGGDMPTGMFVNTLLGWGTSNEEFFDVDTADKIFKGSRAVSVLIRNKFCPKFKKEGLIEPMRQMTDDAIKKLYLEVLAALDSEAKEENKEYIPVEYNLHSVGEFVGHLLFYAVNREIDEKKTDGKEDFGKQILSYKQKCLKDPIIFDKGIDGTILPTVTWNEEKIELNQAVMEAIERLGDNSAFIWGEEGGSGKTTILHKVFSQKLMLEDNCEIPIYIELKDFPKGSDSWYLGHEKAVFLRFVACKIGGYSIESFLHIPFEELEIIRKYLTQEGKYRFVFLLDGLNEVDGAESRILIPEILYLSQCRNVQVLVTGRYLENRLIEDLEDNEDDGKRLIRITLNMLDVEVVRTYLERCHFNTNLLNRVMKNDSLVKILRIPMFLTIFACISEKNITAGMEPISTRGEILYSFFNEKKDKLKIGIQRNRLKINFSIETKEEQYFILDYIVPYVGFYMASQHLYRISREGLFELISSLFTENSVLMKRSRQYEGYEPMLRFRQNWGKGDTYLCVQNIVDFIAKQLCVLRMTKTQRGKREYEFLHEHLRDYFAAIRLKEDINFYCREEGSLESIAVEGLPVAVLNFLGEVIKEHTYVPVCNNEDQTWEYKEGSLLINLLQCLRGKNSLDVQVAISNVIEVLKYSRKNDLSGLDLSELNFSKTWLGGIRFTRWYNEESDKFSSIFDGAVIQAKNFFSYGHSCLVTAIVLDKKSENIFYTADKKGNLKIWDIPEKKCETYKFSDDSIRCMEVYNNILMIADCHKIYEFKLDDKTFKQTILLRDYITKIKITDEGSLLYTNDVRPLTWRDLSGKVVGESFSMELPSSAACMSHDGKIVIYSRRSKIGRIVIYHYNEVLKLWSETPDVTIDIEKGNRVNEIKFSDDETRFLVCVDKGLYEYSAFDGKRLRYVKMEGICYCAMYGTIDTKEVIFYSDGASIKVIDCQGDILHEFYGKTNYMTGIIPNHEGDGYYVSNNGSVKEFDIRENVCRRIYTETFVINYVNPAFHILRNEKTLLIGEAEILCENGLLREPIPLDYRLIDIMQARENASFSAINMGTHIIIFNRDTGEKTEFDIYDDLIIQNCSMKNLKGEIAKANYQDILKRFGAKL